MADGPASARERAEAGGTGKRAFPHLRPLTDTEYAAQHADAIWVDVRSTHYGRANLRQHHLRVADRMAWRFHYEDRVYVLHRVENTPGAWAVSLWIAPWAVPASGLPTEPGQVGAVHGEPLVCSFTREMAVKQLARDLCGTLCDHGYRRGRDCCPGCDVLDDTYNDLPG